ncbi:MAG: AsnC family transcriptional regulator [Chloroflexi bacterium CG_4_9_14_3_um_filter_45_9]|nr:MAG: AsnC family transcriptional regulator [Dehalococcoidia bacterium CG2_30_46_9]PIU23529.1 MAG: AsnC family transcriptional regulator [Chloroflexi bacterium CG08_land_8_20_14_0_20_45_12]PIX27437.1 MAG: AsnC family transcriptional regulator [Chloroflexi bacterium CG_4_8_14_3_um_filter_45_15]PJB49623.1 MAG: AsnC family transcriptional regulator [Chloroflexi bacterium CG_4_9_14_3_um_filter_45_9]
MEQVFEILEQNAKASPEQISTMVGIPASEVEKIIKQAEKDGTIVKYKTTINWAKLGKEEVWALIEVKIAPQRDLGFDAIAERIYQFPQVYSAYLVSGTYDLAVLVKGRNMREISSFVTEKLAPLERVQSTVTHFLLKRYKENGEIFQPSLENKRLAITP